MTTLSRTTSFEFQDGDEGKAVHLDAKQRVVIQKAYGAICAEPSPDALSAVAISSAASLTGPSKHEVALAQSLSEAAGSLGLRTQSIQLMRDALYRVCEMYFSRALDDTQVMILHQKYQDVLIAVLAVEQLTGPVLGAQTTLTSAANNSALARSRDMAKELIEAREKLNALKADQSAAAKAETEAKESADQAAAAYEEAKTSPPPANELESAGNKRDSAAAEYAQAKATKEAKDAAVSDAEKYVQVLEDSKDAALRQAQTEAKTGSAVNSGASTKNVLEEKTAQHVAKAVQAIVESVVGRDYTAAGCLSIISDIDDIIPRRDAKAAHDGTREESPEDKKLREEVWAKQKEIIDRCLQVVGDRATALSLIVR